MACALVLVLTVTSCASDGKPTAVPTPCVTPTPIPGIERIPAELQLAQCGDLVRLDEQKQTMNGDIQTTLSVLELYPALSHTILDNHDFAMKFAENEGFEAEIFFIGTRHRFGAYRVRKGPCPGLVTIRFFYGQRKTRIPGLHTKNSKK